MSSCKTCDSWGEVVKLADCPTAVACPTCKRLFRPNRGAGVSASGINAVMDVAGDTGKAPHPLAVYAFAKMRQAAARRGRKK